MSKDAFPKDLPRDLFVQFRDLIHHSAGIFIEDERLDSLRISLLARGTRLGCSDFGQYFDIVSRDEAELAELLNLVTVNETSFFRFPQQFEALKTLVVPEIVASRQNADREVRIWSAGCSTGEEPYSIAITLAEAGLPGLGWAPRVLGTDVSVRALQTAEQGVYGARALLNVPPDLAGRYFTPEGDHFRVARRIRSFVEFSRHNLIKEPYPNATAAWDAIFCRNVTIYFRPESTRRVIAHFFERLTEGGYLFVGHSETLSSFTTAFEVIETDGVFLYRKPRRHHPHARPVSPGTQAPGREGGDAGSPAPPGRSRTHERAAPSATSDETLLDQARMHLHGGSAAQALALAEEAVAAEPGDARALLTYAHALADLGRLDEAVAACESALAADPLLAGARYLLGVIAQRRGDLERAAEELRKTVYADPDFALAHLSLANISKARREWAAAERGYENARLALERSPEGSWTAFLGGFRVELLAATCERSLLECRRAQGVKHPHDR